DRGPVAALGPVAARLVVARRERGPVGLRAGDDAVLIGRVAAAVDGRSLFGERGLLVQIVGAVQLGDILGNDVSLGVLPRAFADAVLGIHGRGRARRLRAQVRLPR